MKFAVTKDGEKVQASKGMEAVCPVCLEPVLARCGRIKIHHWAHVADLDCDQWTEPETEWHRDWKAQFDSRFVEVPMGPHRADLRNGKGVVIELQNSNISPAEIQEREQFYGNMVWVVNAALFADRFFLTRQMGPNIFSFKWKNMRPSWLAARKPVYLDMGRFPVKDLFGVEFAGASAFSSGVFKNIARYDGSNGAHLHRSLVGIAEEIRSCCVLKLNTVYKGGRGSVQAVSLADLKAWLGTRIPD